MTKMFHPSVSFPDNVSVVDIIEVLPAESNLSYVYETLAQYKDRIFKSHERLLILLIDADYYPSLDSAGNNTFNLFESISQLDISSDHIIILTNCPGMEKEIFHLCDIKNLSYPKIINFLLWYTYPVITDKLLTVNHDKKFLYSCLNGQPRAHRKTLMALLYQNNLIDCGMISYYPGNPKVEKTNLDRKLTNLQEDKLLGIHFRTTMPFLGINEDLSLCRQSKILNIKYSNELGSSIKSKEIIGQPNDISSKWATEFLKQSLIYISTETVGNYPYPFITEKTWKAMLTGMPFMILGAKYSLKFLKDCGFKTFSDFWDESYDEKDSVIDRCAIIVDNLKNLKQQDWTLLSTQLQPTITHNFNHLPIFLNSQLDSIRNLLT